MNDHLQECIDECNKAVAHLNKALPMAHPEAKEKMEHAVKDLEECITTCEELM